jgi:CRISPR-associated protein Cas5d
VSYDVITPSSARAVFEAIYWKPQIRWRITRIDVLKPVRWINLRRNEVGKVVPSSIAHEAMSAGHGNLALYIEDERQQRSGLLLRDVGYRLHAEMQLVGDEARANPKKYLESFERRALKGQCVNQPYLGCREFAADFHLVKISCMRKPRNLASMAISVGCFMTSTSPIQRLRSRSGFEPSPSGASLTSPGARCGDDP